MDLNLEGKRAVVTGASLGIGEASVKMLADHGANVSFCARSKEAVDALSAQKVKSGSIKGFEADMGDKKSTEGFINAVLSDGPVDILVNNVGASPSRNFLYMTDEDWQELHELNLLSAVRCTRAFLPHMRENKWGRVVMISSSAGKYPSAALIDYGATKAAMISISKSLGLPWWDKPAQPCLASRIPFGEEISSKRLKQIALAEEWIINQGFSKVRVRSQGLSARIELPANEINNFLKIVERNKLIKYFLSLGFHSISLDLEGLISGKLTRDIKTT